MKTKKKKKALWVTWGEREERRRRSETRVKINKTDTRAFLVESHHERNERKERPSHTILENTKTIGLTYYQLLTYNE